MPAVSPDLDARQRTCAQEVLRLAELAYVAMVEPSEPGGTPRPYVIPMNFAYEPPNAPACAAPEGRLYLHTGPGRKMRALERNPRVCVSVIADESLQLGATPCDDGYLYQSVLLEGRALLLADEAARERALRAIVAKYDPAATAKPFRPGTFAKTIMYVVEVETIGFKERPKRR